MANTKSAKKSARQNEQRRQQNLGRRTAIKTAIKKVIAALDTKQDQAQVQVLFKDACAKLARAKNKDVVHQNTAARKISRLARKIAKASQAQQPAQAQ